LAVVWPTRIVVDLVSRLILDAEKVSVATVESGLVKILASIEPVAEWITCHSILTHWLAVRTVVEVAWGVPPWSQILTLPEVSVLRKAAVLPALVNLTKEIVLAKLVG